MSTRRVAYFLIFDVVALLIAIPLIFWLPARQKISATTDFVEPTNVAIVFGAGLTSSGEPSDVLRDRLTIAAELYQQKLVTTILVSGDNRTESYNEPDTMKQTLVEDFDLPEESIVTDYGGRRTYDTCRRANELWGVEKAVLVSQAYHLPRAIWTCESLGISSEGVSASLQPYVKNLLFKIREIAAIYKTFLDLYFIEPTYIRGEIQEDLDT